ncbi:predicted protein [Naegleria gruberi]|uniref:Predicted protein n=1 Tax=Naegleria gruberi TaxID=5762 RepID=D2VIS8_NAEGR|nr:uncharacterized protein NAEGRDRAFT_34419 [Naegleria gruberi]EFC43404.1 predicted protein [Naegleria gruberi]|eukprot:XP_002676148.1 predicted protein [Naegleria gruberi strain NEG-M]
MQRTITSENSSSASSSSIAGGRNGLEVVLDNIEAALKIGSILKTTYGPFGRDKLFCERESGKITITNDGATILQYLKRKIKKGPNDKQQSKVESIKWAFSTEPVIELLVNISQTQDEQVGDGTTSVVLLACALLRQAKHLLNLGYNVHTIIQSYKLAHQLVEKELKEIELHLNLEDWNESTRNILIELVRVPFNSKILKNHSSFFASLLVDSYYKLRTVQQERNSQIGDAFSIENIQFCPIPGSSIQDSFVIEGICFRRPFYYAGYEQQQKKIENPKILILNHELELKHQKEFARIVINNPIQYQNFIETEWNLLKRQLDVITNTKCDLILNLQTTGDIATQWFTQNGITSLGKMDSKTIESIVKSLGGQIFSSIEDLSTMYENEQLYGTCSMFEEKTVGEDFYCILSGFKKSGHDETMTIVLRGEENILEESKRSMHDALCILENVIREPICHLGGGATEMHLKTLLHKYCLDKSTKTTNSHALSILECMKSFGKSLEEIVFILCDNAGLNASKVIETLSLQHESGNTYCGLNLSRNSIMSLLPPHHTKPCGVKRNIFQTATEAACFILSIDFVVVMPSLESEEERANRLASEYQQQERLSKQWSSHLKNMEREKTSFI